MTDHLDRVRRQFTRQADAYAAMPQTRDDPGLEALVTLAAVAGGHHVLDVACGPGFLTMAFARHCARAVGVDATPALLARARAEAARRRLENVAFEEGDAAALAFGDASFDVVACRAAFHHFPRPERVLAEMRRTARPNGRILVADMLGSDDPARAAHHDVVERLCDPTHVRALPAAEFERLFAGAGLEVLARRSGRMHYDLEAWIAHGGPAPATAAEIRRLFEASLEVDRYGLGVRREDGRLRFSHTVATWVLAVPAGR